MGLKSLSATLFLGLITASAANALPAAMPRDAKNLVPENERNNLVHKVYTLQEQTMDKVNWVYLGYAPRIQDPNRIRVILSKQGFTMRVNFEMTPEEVADYPSYLQRRSKAVESILFPLNMPDGHFINMKQIHKFLEFQDQAQVISENSSKSFKDGYYFLSHLFPHNVRQVVCSFDTSKMCVEGNFVYPITAHRDAMMTLKGGARITKPMAQATPPSKTYYTQFLDERRSAHYEYSDGYRTGAISDHLFDGFPAFWFKTAPGSKGVGVHGPIRYSSALDKGGVIKNDYINDPTYWTGINPLYRFEIVRTANSEGCIRSEPMELRHLLPSDPKAVYQVPIHIIDQIDTVYENGREYYVDVDYYVENHYRKQNKRDWYLKHYISYEERQQAKSQGRSIEQILDDKLARTKVFPYLHPRTYEFHYLRNGLNEDAPSTMSRLNQAPRK